MDVFVVFWDLEEHWMELTDAVKLMIIVTVQQIVYSIQNILFLIFGSATEANLCVVRKSFGDYLTSINFDFFFLI